MLLPRIYSPEPDHDPANYKKWVDIQDGVKPTMGQNLGFLLRYQMGHMFWRYFMWNFVGRESDVQQAGVVTPFSPGKASLPARIAESPARNNFLAMPLILGLLGLFFQSRRDGKDALGDRPAVSDDRLWPSCSTSTSRRASRASATTPSPAPPSPSLSGLAWVCWDWASCWAKR